MKLFEKINKTCRHGHHAVVETDEGQYVIVSPFKDVLGYWRISEADETIEEAGQTIGSYDGSPEERWDELENDGWKFQSVYTPSFQYYKEGDLVDVLPNAKDLPEYDEWVLTFNDVARENPYRVDFISNGQVYLRGTHDLPQHCLAPLFEETSLASMTGSTGECKKCTHSESDPNCPCFNDGFNTCEAEEGFTNYEVPNPSTTNFTVQIKDLDDIDTDTSVFEYLDKLARNQKYILERLEKIN